MVLENFAELKVNISPCFLCPLKCMFLIIERFAFFTDRKNQGYISPHLSGRKPCGGAVSGRGS